MELDGGMGLAKSSRAGSGKESLRAQVNTLRGKIAELRRFPLVKSDSADVGWLADPEAQAQVAEVSHTRHSSICPMPLRIVRRRSREVFSL